MKTHKRLLYSEILENLDYPESDRTILRFVTVQEAWEDPSKYFIVDATKTQVLDLLDGKYPWASVLPGRSWNVKTHPVLKKSRHIPLDLNTIEQIASEFGY